MRGISAHQLRAVAEQYVKWDPNQTTCAPVRKLLAKAETGTDAVASSLESLFHGRLKFGTAGLRARFGPGYNQMNDLTVIQTAQGLAKYLMETTDAKAGGVVIGYDHRCSASFSPYDLSSKNFAHLTAAVLESRGIPFYLFPDFVATPLVPFATTAAKAACGIMVTASHNPKEDTGYKVYWGNGAQIIPPHDANISRHILDNLDPWDPSAYASTASLPDLGRPTEEFQGAYFDSLRSQLCHSFDDNLGAEHNITYTAMHGVGHDFARR